MSDPDDYELQRGDVEPPPEGPPSRSMGWWMAGALLTVAAGIVIYVTFARRPIPAPAATAAPPPAVAQEPPRPLGREAEAVTVPPLAESDPLVRTLVRALSTHRVVAAWLATDGLIRNFTAAVVNIADGAAPSKQLTALRPSAAFRVLERGRASYVDPRNYDRSTPVADAVASIDPAGAAKLYATLKPRIEEAAGELGYPDRQFDRVLEKAIVALLRTPTLDGPLQVTPNAEGIGYAYADGRLEPLSAPQKALLRMGPRNGRIIKATLREIALALGIPPARLPPA